MHPNFVFVHKNCGKTAFYLKYNPQAGEALVNTNAYTLEGLQPVAGDNIVCGSCLGQMNEGDFDIELITELGGDKL